MRYTITKDFAFSASHQLAGLPADHQCARLHGHNYVVRVELSSDVLDETGFVLDYGKLGFVKDLADQLLDHRHLNDQFKFNPTAENLAAWFLYQIETHPRIPAGVAVAVGVSETPKTWAWVRP
jgi:6-pyruvoyltetrahydropterin/6-carboxytetrahydropterin synthase